MTDFDDRKNSFESKFAYDNEIEFKIKAKRDKLMGKWVAEQLLLSEDDAEVYADNLVQVDLNEKGDEDIITKIISDFKEAGIKIEKPEIKRQLERCYETAREKITGER